MPKISAKDVRVPADVPAEARQVYVENYLKATQNTGRLMLFACDQKIEHLNDDFYGQGISPDDSDPEHLFRIGSQGRIGVLAAQRGLISHYATDYPDINYLVKVNSKSNLIDTAQRDPQSANLTQIYQILDLIDNGVNIVGIGYTIYLGSEFEAEALAEAAGLIAEAHLAGLLVVLWIYPRGKAVKNEKDAQLIAGAAGVACSIGADFVKVNPPSPSAKSADTNKDGKETSAGLLARASRAAGRCQLVCAGGSTVDAKTFLTQLHEQIHIGGASGNATGRNIHQRDLSEAVALTKAISAITLDDASVADALKIFDAQ